MSLELKGSEKIMGMMELILLKEKWLLEFGDWGRAAFPYFDRAPHEIS